MRSVSKWSATVAIVAAAGVTAGAQFATAQDDGPAPAPTPVCELVTKDEATAALGDAVVVNDAGRSCAFTVTKSGAFSSLSVGLGPDGVTAASFAEGMRTYAEMANVTLRAVYDTGDEAWVALDDQVSQLVARRGERFVSVIFVNVKTPADERIATMAELARKGLTRIG
jgi:hypothetical protein